MKELQRNLLRSFCKKGNKILKTWLEHVIRISELEIPRKILFVNLWWSNVTRRAEN